MNSGAMRYLLPNLMYQSPALIAYGVGLVLALANWGRFPRPSQFLFFGSVLLLAGALALPVYQAVSHRSYGSFNAISIAATVVRAAGFGLVLAAVFSGRRQPDGLGGSGFQVMPPPPMPPMMPPPGRRA